MPRVTIYNYNCIVNKEAVSQFIEKIDNLISKIDPSIDITELESLKRRVVVQKMYDHTDIWTVESIEDSLSKQQDLPF